MASTSNGEAASASTPLIDRERQRRMLTRNVSRADDELRSFRSCLRWLCIDLTGLPFSTAWSWFLFLFLAGVVPGACHYFLGDLRPYDCAIQMSMSGAATLAFVSLSTLARRYGLRRSLFLDRLRRDSDRVRAEYIGQLGGFFRFLAILLLPCCFADALIKAYWYYETWTNATAKLHIPNWMASPWAASAVYLLELLSFAHRTAIMFLACVLFQLNCGLLILRMEDFAKVFHEEFDVASILKQHIRIRKQLKIISHRYRSFIVSCLVVVTASQFWTLLLTTRPHARVNVFTTGELVLCSLGLVIGVLLCLRSAAKITHKTQAITSQAAMWHICATIDPSERHEVPATTPTTTTTKTTKKKPNLILNTLFKGREHSSVPITNGGISSDDSDSEGEADIKTLMSSSAASNISYHKRQALVTYLENNRAGISVYGFVVDRTWLHALFMIEFSLVMWLLGKTIGI